ncbi:MAG: 16S rRNA (cytidine(1402)-2'-O)-methyltransferase [Candidatus Competibacteraceae bacterium]|nr:16S rRNA (cytidine(1402)-2'-O)-methyltransferase [Candidatus Competibacteraceae bacterium]MBK7982791.1 16S rRNA (cytidine(1402)-2'-O)-methyltransferase [Candidatus Competibacteraceae bacterium]MBK8898662.1 16S rRNA (cytidine(1402)-2'-O)-methyltransferase [Candidatus Competibacteraceae bacterium]MBK8962462.1 16S rRNA (cytidine(1402)-2'-O)-methyltransferase [Candidatus Competibacteraceae bacterium]MBK9951678.1 16S rRNA (cytidine(1402)-2'-O)-methyltransferase [Candidatus Competibacteraceae bact
MTVESGALYVVATPIGNLEDITLRALRVLREVDYIAAEDTRHTGRLLRHFEIDKPLLSLHEHNERNRLEQVAALLEQGKYVALVSDAGTPLLSDPGFPLVRELRRRALRVIPVPGPSSLLAALSAAGLPTDRFVFEGFLPAKSAARRERLRALAREERTLIFFESSHRLAEALLDLATEMGGDRPAVIARELTKRFEEIQGAPLAELLPWLRLDPNRSKGEFVILVRGAPTPIEADTPDNRRLLAALLSELPASRAVVVAARLTGLRKQSLYDLALALGHEQTPEKS